MKRFIVCVLALLLLFCGGCKKLFRGRTEIDDIMFVKIFGIDGADEQGIKIILNAKVAATTSEGEQGGKSTTRYISGVGKTVYDAISSMLKYSDKSIFLGDAEFILFDEEILKKGIIPYIDFLLRDAQVRNNARIYMLKGIEVADLIKSTENAGSLSDRIRRIEDESTNSTNSMRVTIVEAAKFLMESNASTYIPILQPTNAEHGEEESKDKIDFELNGFAIVQDGKLIGELNEPETKGLVWLRNKVDTGTLVVKDPEGAGVVLQIIDAETKMVPSTDGQNLYVDVYTQLDSNLSEDQGVVKFSEEYLHSLVQSQNELVTQQIQSTLNYAQSHRVDMFGVSHAFYNRYPFRFKQWESNWMTEVFPKIQFRVHVESKFGRSYLIRHPIMPEK